MIKSVAVGLVLGARVEAAELAALGVTATEVRWRIVLGGSQFRVANSWC